MKKLTKQYVIIRAAQAGVFAGYLEYRKGDEVKLTDARRLWYWAGAASLSQLSQDGTSRPGDCKFPAPVPEIIALGVIEIIPTSAKAHKSIISVAVWKK